ncbi:DUF4105 domain-containing protein [uncultured Muribaculum sp.]|uniref:Lnb N-terminal periplasmic domain-containing protein n=1 Tax=uncultured Muribaculum sp. TaxID=1918613 RepID=UPI002594C507|nr:DUF4105 domain-containing protein [uncultured Muribaculum sp.]
MSLNLILRRVLPVLFFAFSCIGISGTESEAGDTLVDIPRISLITCGPGSDIYELEGHTALRVRYNGADVAVNYGLFDFDAPNFVYRFVKGETDYMVGAAPFDYFLRQYARAGRAVYEQPLRLSSDAAFRLVALLDENLRPENRTYRYNYVKDNCATRPLEMIERAIGDTLSLKAREYTEGWTFRDAMRHYHAGYPWYQFGIDLALGSGIDYVLADREKAFVPVVLMEMVEDNGIADETTMILAPGNEAVSATPWWMTPLAVGVAVLLAVVAVAARDVKRMKVTRWVDALLFGIYGIAGLLITFLVFISEHEATSPNWLLLWLNPLCLIVPAFIYIKSCRKLVKLYGIVNFVALFLLSILWLWSGQSGNTAFIPLILADAILTIRYLYITQCLKQTNRI